MQVQRYDGFREHRRGDEDTEGLGGGLGTVQRVVEPTGQIFQDEDGWIWFTNVLNNILRLQESARGSIAVSLFRRFATRLGATITTSL